MSEKNVKFLQLIENNQCLYNNTLVEYSRKDTTEKAWSAIAKEMKYTVADCKEKWKNIRNGFVRTIKLNASIKGKKPYYLHDAMQFVLPYIRPIQHLDRTTSISLSDNETTLTQPDDNEFHCFSTEHFTEDEHNNEPAKRKRTLESPLNVPNKKIQKNHLKEREDVHETMAAPEKKDTKTSNYRKMFLLSLLPDVDNLSERNLRQFKIKSLILLEQMLTSQEQSTRQFHDVAQIIDYPTGYDIKHESVSRRSSESFVEKISPSPVDENPTTLSNLYS